jgi:radical SAM protein with 4Fe4S-binding SPASM domain
LTVLFLVKTLERVPRTCVWELTTRCNLRCIHCECNAGRHRKNELSTTEALDLCEQLADLGTEKVSLSGGEPLLRKDWPVIATRLGALGIETNLITNGILLTPDIADCCVDTGISWLSISIDGLMDTHDSIRLYPKGIHRGSTFRKAFEALALSRSKGLKTSVITHINGRNITEIEELHRLLGIIPIDGWQLQLGTPQGRMLDTEEGYLVAPEQLPGIADFIEAHQGKPFRIVVTDDIGYYTEQESFLRELDDKHFPFWVGCYAGILGIAIESDGGIKGCPSLPSTMIEGNVRERTLREIWQDPNTFPYNRKWDIRKLKGFCRQCEFRKLCRAGCTSFALASTGSIYENRHCLYRVQALQGRGDDDTCSLQNRGKNGKAHPSP